MKNEEEGGRHSCQTYIAGHLLNMKLCVGKPITVIKCRAREKELETQSDGAQCGFVERR